MFRFMNGPLRNPDPGAAGGGTGAPGVALTGDEGQAQEALLKAEVARLVAEQLAASKTSLTPDEQRLLQQFQPKGDPEPFKLTVFGQEHEYPDQATAMKAVEAAILQAQQAATRAGQPAPAQNVAAAPEFSKEEFAKRIEADVLGGLRYAMSFVPEVQTLQQDNMALKQALAVAQFRSNVPTFNPNPQEVQVMNQVLAELGLNPTNPASLEAAYALSVQRGLVKPRVEQPATAQAQSQFAPPVLGRGATTAMPLGEDFAAMVERLPKEKIRELIDSGKFH